MGQCSASQINSTAHLLLLLLLHCRRGVLLKSSVGDLEAAQSTDSNIQNQNAQERGHEAHEDTCQAVRIEGGPPGHREVRTRSKILVFIKQRLAAIWGVRRARV